MENILKNHTQGPHKKYKYDHPDLIKSQMLIIKFKKMWSSLSISLTIAVSLCI